MRIATTKGFGLAASAAVVAMLLGACGGGDAGTTAEATVVDTATEEIEVHETEVTDAVEVVDTGAAGEAAASASGEVTCPEGDVTIKVQTFNNFGFGPDSAGRPGADEWAKYHELCPNVTVDETVAATSDDARAAFNSSISAGSAAYDVFAVDIDWMPSITVMPERFLDLTPYVRGNDWLDWKKAQGTAPDGKILGMGTDIGPEGICYRADLLDAAGIPSDRESVKEWLGGDNGTWDDFFKAGDEYVEKSGGKAFFDSSAAVMQGMVNQVQNAWVDNDGNLIAADNQEMHDLYNKLTDAAINRHQSAGLAQWSGDWNAAMSSDQFAVMLCPAWIINNIKGNAGDNFVGWDIADQFPGGGGNWGGSFLVVPENSENKEAAADLVQWLTSPEQQAAVFEAASNFPSSPTAQAMPVVAERTEPFLNDAPIGQIFTNRAKAVSVVPFKGYQYFDVQTAMANALNRVDVDKNMDAAASWDQFLNDVRALG